MAARKIKKPILVKVGPHFINPNDISRISKADVRDDMGYPKPLYVVEFISNPSPKFNCWIERKDISILLDQFEIITGD